MTLVEVIAFFCGNRGGEGMKNKRLMSALIILMAVLVGSFIQDKTIVKKNDTANNEMKKIGVLQYVSHPALDDIYRGIKAGLAEKGYDEETIDINFQNGQADQSKLKIMSQKLIDEKSDVLIGIATPAAQSLANSTKDIPIVLGAVSDPKAANLVNDNHHPGGNITGVSDQSPVSAQLDLMMALLPETKTVGVLYTSSEANSLSQSQKVVMEGEKRGLKVKTYPVPSSNEMTQVVQGMSEEVDAIYLPTDNVIANAAQIVVDIANKKNVPIIPSVDTMIEQGGLATVGINQYKLGVQAGRMAGDVLSGKAVPATTPIYTFDKGERIINKKQAEKLKIDIPKAVLDSAKIIY